MSGMDKRKADIAAAATADRRQRSQQQEMAQHFFMKGQPVVALRYLQQAAQAVEAVAAQGAGAERDTAFPCTSAASLPRTDAFARGAAVGDADGSGRSKKGRKDTAFLLCFHCIPSPRQWLTLRSVQVSGTSRRSTR